MDIVYTAYYLAAWNEAGSSEFDVIEKEKPGKNEKQKREGRNNGLTYAHGGLVQDSKCTGIPAALPHLLYSKEEEEQEGDDDDDDDDEEVEKEEREGAQDGVEHDAVQEARYLLYRIYKKKNKEREVNLGEEAIEERAYQKKRVFLPSWRQSSLRAWPPPLAAVCVCVVAP
ncbi:hypothetical protein PV325_006765 [Microctonus aethiopoides]|nr:hypothetical protein PV325_006765 [Microctonus aethiopoides]